MKIFRLLTLNSALLIGLVGSHAALASVQTFGSGANQFSMEFVPIGSPGNAADATGNPNPAGAVPYEFNMGKYEVSRDMITKANNLGNLGITLFNSMLFPASNGPDRPATGMSWNEAARFVNWLNTSQGYSAAYKFRLQPGDAGYNALAMIDLWTSSDPGFNPANPYRNSNAQYFLPSLDEWYKAAYYDPNANGGSGGYWDYPTGSNTAPAQVLSGADPNTAVFGQSGSGQVGPADITLAGGLSPFGTMAQGGNVYELLETASDLGNNNVREDREVRGGYWAASGARLSSSSRDFPANPLSGSSVMGFRVASLSSAAAVVPEAGSLVIWGLLGLLAPLAGRRRLRKWPFSPSLLILPSSLARTLIVKFGSYSALNP